MIGKDGADNYSLYKLSAVFLAYEENDSLCFKFK